MNMNLKKKDFNAIGDYVKLHLADWLREPGIAMGNTPALNERMIRVEEELKHQRELMQAGFKRMDERFEQSDKRFESLTKRMDRFMVWSFTSTIAATGIIISVLKFT